MRTIDMQTWARREHFQAFGAFDHPYFSIGAHVDLTSFYPAVKERGTSFTAAIVYVLARAANAIPEFRQRIRGEAVVEHEVVHPSWTVLRDTDLFTFCTVEYVEDFSLFAARAEAQSAHVKEHPTLEDDLARDDLLYMTAIPWVSFTSFTHPMHLQAADSIPRLAWGKFFAQGDSLQIPLDVQVHHGLVDGIHVGRFYEEVEALLREPALVLR